jgi:hypothetical protein
MSYGTRRRTMIVTKEMYHFSKVWKGFLIFVLGLVFNLVESFYFGKGTEMGFNMNAASRPELICDYISVALIIAGFFMMGLAVARSRTTVVICAGEDTACSECDCHCETEGCEETCDQSEKNIQNETQDTSKM